MILRRVGGIVFPLGHIGESPLISHLAELVLFIPLIWIGRYSLTEGKASLVTVLGTA